MRGHAEELAPGPDGVLRGRTRFFRRGSGGAGHEALDSARLARCTRLPGPLIRFIVVETPAASQICYSTTRPCSL